MAQHDARALLAALAGGRTRSEATKTPREANAAYHDRIERAVAATADFEAASKFLSERDLDELERAIEGAERDLSAHAEEGRDALETLRDLQNAANDRNLQTAADSRDLQTAADSRDLQTAADSRDLQTAADGGTPSDEDTHASAAAESQFQFGRSSSLGGDDVAADR